MTELSKTYNPKEVEEKWLKIWLDEKLFASRPDPINKDNNFSIALPPPNVTGSLHMGHAFGDTIQDVLIRYNKMNGKNVLWQGGTDHAGIATQVLVEREISKNEKKRKEDLGREEFLKRVWVWKEKHGNEIINQMKKLGCMLDYDHLVFTMEDNYSFAVKKGFIDLYKKDLIYRGKRIVNWCPKCLTSISDLEVETEQIKGKLFHILYPFDLKDFSKGGLTVATTRPETMFGDIAVAVNPNDGRYKKLIGTKVFLPFINKQIPIIGDEAIELDFGTGCLKVTPAHDLVDYEIFERHKELGTYPEIMSPNGKIIDKENIGIPSDIQDLDRFKARELTVQKLEELGLLKQVIEYDQACSKHDRCGTVIEPYLSEQWYVKMNDKKHSLSISAIEAVEDGRVKFIPDRYAEHYKNWLRNIKDWCISRQLWWGHQIPAWHCKKCNSHGVVQLERREYYGPIKETIPAKCDKCSSPELVQDPDVLDTWFSSALWPFATLECRDDANLVKDFYPTTVLATAREIINLWVSRMVFMSLEFKKDVPFKEVLIHPVIQTPDGKRMSKSKGNAIDPLEMIEKYGADANRFWYFSVGVTGNQDVRFPGRKDKDGKWESDILEKGKRFANKIWNVNRFVIEKLENKTFEANLDFEQILERLDQNKLTIPDKWILHEYCWMLSNINEYFKNHNYSFVTQRLFRFIWFQFCDGYVEDAKEQLNIPEIKENTQAILFYVLEGLIRAFQPIMPFITEEIWQRLPKSALDKIKFISQAKYPNSSNLSVGEFTSYAQSYSFIKEINTVIRNKRQEANLPWSNEITVNLLPGSRLAKGVIEALKIYIESQTKSKVVVLEKLELTKPSLIFWVPETPLEVLNPDINVSNGNSKVKGTRGLIVLSKDDNLDNMLSSLNKKKDSFEKEMKNQKTKLNNANFINNAAQDKIDEVKTRVNELENQIKTIDEQIELLK